MIQGDTANTPYGWGTWGSRSAVAGGGAVINATTKIREKMVRVAANLMEVSPRDLEVEETVHFSQRQPPGKNMTLRDVAQAAVYTADVTGDEEPGLEASNYYKAPTPYANATHVAVVEVDPGNRLCKDQAVPGGRRLRRDDQPYDRRGANRGWRCAGDWAGVVRASYRRRERADPDDVLHGTT